MPAQPPAGAPMEIFAEAVDWLIVIGGGAMQPDRMYKDWPDICHLLEQNRSEWTPDQLKQLADRYASDEFAAELRRRGFL